MGYTEDIPLVRTIKERCRVCYTCVRECPAKAIRIADGQAEVLDERCIGCGNCVRVCSQHAKEVLASGGAVSELLEGDAPVAAILAPSFPAEFDALEPDRLVGRIRALGFELVNEVAAGADLVAAEYKRLLEGDPARRYIATSCPAIVAFVERYHPDLVEQLAPIVSPMVAAARALRMLHGADLKIVFIGPCIAKKGEAGPAGVPDEIDAVLTFAELRELLEARGVAPEAVEPTDFDRPHAGPGALFAISRGLLQAAEIREDLVSGEVVAADGRTSFVDAIKEFESGDLDARLLEVLCCNGCIMGAGMTAETPLFSRRRKVSEYVRGRVARGRDAQWQADMDALAGVDLSRSFRQLDQRIPVPFAEEIEQIMRRMGKFRPEDELNCGACGYDTCREHAIAIFKGLAESEMCLPFTIEQLKDTIGQLGERNEQLASAQEALRQSERLASMGQLAAGIAHEVNNPLGVVLMFAHLLLEEAGGDPKLREDLETITREADRCKKIVAGLLDFARQNKVSLEPTDLRELVDRSLITVPRPDNVEVDVTHEAEDLTAEMDRDQMIQVVTNLISNAFGAMPEGGKVTLHTRDLGERVQLSVADSGVGIPPENLNKIFEPFFTTKHIGKGTGLGLSVSYGIVKMHRGDITVESNADPEQGPTGTTFTITLKRRPDEASTQPQKPAGPQNDSDSSPWTHSGLRGGRSDTDPGRGSGGSDPGGL